MVAFKITSFLFSSKGEHKSISILLLLAKNSKLGIIAFTLFYSIAMVGKVLAMQKVVCSIFNFQTGRTCRIQTVLKNIMKFVFIKMTEA